MSRGALRIATRGSPLALVQAQAVADRLGDTEIVIIKTEGDRNTTASLASLGGRGVFTTEVQAALLDGRADVAVHSAKDLPSSAELQVEGLVLAAVPERADPRDCLIGSTLEELPDGATVGTGSPRRRVLLHQLRPDLHCVELRGNIATRLARVGELDAIVGAVAALTRLGLADRITEALDPATFVPQVGQGALAVECRDDNDVRTKLAAIDDANAHTTVRAERAFLARLGGGCDAPVGAYAFFNDDRLWMTGLIANDKGAIATHRDAGNDPVELGERIASELLSVDW